MHNESESDATCEPVRLCQAIFVNWSGQSINSAEIYCGTVPNREDDPSPEDCEIEVFAHLACSVDLGEGIDVLIVDILL